MRFSIIIKLISCFFIVYTAVSSHFSDCISPKFQSNIYDYDYDDYYFFFSFKLELKEIDDFLFIMQNYRYLASCIQLAANFRLNLVLKGLLPSHIYTRFHHILQVYSDPIQPNFKREFIIKKNWVKVITL